MSTYINPKGSPPVAWDGPIFYPQQDLADACRKWGSKLNVPAGIDSARFLWAFALKESGGGTDCRPRHEAGYCTGSYSTHTDVVTAFKRWGHIAHCSLGPWQMLYINDHLMADPALFGQLDYAAYRTVTFFNSEIFGHQQARTIEQAADAWNSGNFRDTNVPTDYISAILYNYSNVPVPPARTITIHASGSDAQDVYQDFVDAIEGLGEGFHFAPFRGVPIDVDVAGAKHDITGAEVQWVSDGDGKRIDSITIQAL